MSEIQPAPIWKRVLATILDFNTAAIVAGYAVAASTGNLIEGGGFKIEGPEAFTAFVLIAAYFVIGRKILRGTLWDRVFRIGRPQPY